MKQQRIAVIRCSFGHVHIIYTDDEGKTHDAIVRDALLGPKARYTAKIKFDIIQGVRLKIVSEEEVRARHRISDEEWAQLNSDYDKGGVKQLRMRKGEGRVGA